MIGARLGDAGSHGADADFGDEFDRNGGRGIDVLQIEDQLGQILDRVDVVMGRRRNQGDARRRVAHPGDGGIDLVAGQLAAFAGLRSLRHLDLELIGIDEIFRRDAEPAGGHLLDRRAHRIAVGQPLEAIRLLAAFAGVGAPPMRFMAIARVVCASRLIEPKDMAPVAKRRTIALAGSTSSSGTGCGPTRRGADPEQAAQGLQMFALLVDRAGIVAEPVAAVAAHRVLQLGDRLGRPHMRLAPDAEVIFAADIEGVGEDRIFAEGMRHGVETPPRRSRRGRRLRSA